MKETNKYRKSLLWEWAKHVKKYGKRETSKIARFKAKDNILNEK